MTRIIRKSAAAIRARLSVECGNLRCYTCRGCSHWCHKPDAWR